MSERYRKAPLNLSPNFNNKSDPFASNQNESFVQAEKIKNPIYTSISNVLRSWASCQRFILRKLRIDGLKPPHFLQKQFNNIITVK